MCHSARYFTNITLSSQTHTKMSASIVILKKSKRVQKQDLLLECCTLRWGSWDVNPVLCSSIKMSSKEVSIVGPGFQLDPFLSNSKAPKCVCVCMHLKWAKNPSGFCTWAICRPSMGLPSSFKKWYQQWDGLVQWADFFIKGNVSGPTGDWIHGPVVQEWQVPLTAVNLTSPKGTN